MLLKADCRRWKAASTKRLGQLWDRPLHDLPLCVILIDGKEFDDLTLITALGVDIGGSKHLLGLWPGATENAEASGQLLDELIERGLSTHQRYLFILDGSKALKKAVKARFGQQVLIQHCCLHKERNIQKYLPKKYRQLLEVGKRFHRIKGHRDLPLLIERLKEVIDHQQAVA